MGIMFSLTDAGRLVHNQPGLYPQFSSEEMRTILGALEHGALSFDDIVRNMPWKMFRVLQEMAAGMAMGVLKAESSPGPDCQIGQDQDRGLGHGHW